MRNNPDKNEQHENTRIAIPTDDEETIFPGMLGRAKQFFIYELKDGNTVELKEKRTNPYSKTMQHLKTLDVYEIIRDCPVIISAKIGKKGIQRLQKKNIHLFFKTGKIENALAELNPRLQQYLKFKINKV